MVRPEAAGPLQLVSREVYDNLEIMHARPSSNAAVVQSALPGFQACHEGTRRLHGSTANLPLTRTPRERARQSKRRRLCLGPDELEIAI